jgi:predicted ATPase
MYLDRIRLEQFRTFRDADIALLHPDQDFKKLDMPRPKLANVNLVLGNNGLGKSAFLKGIALAALGPAAGDAGIYPYRLVRREPGPAKPTKASKKAVQEREAKIFAVFTPHAQDRVPSDIRQLVSQVHVTRKEDLEKVYWANRDEKLWHPIYRADSDSLFFVGYGATRRVERKEQVDFSSRRASHFVRAQRIQSLFEDSYSLVPLTAWLPQMKANNPGRYTQIKHLINALTGPKHFQFTGDLDHGEYLFERGGLKIPFPALSDGYRAYLGWIGDLLYHVAMTCPSGKKLVENRGIVMVDEIDLHLHPKWQMTVLPVLARALPNIQFIVTSHSALVVGSLEWMNIIVMQRGPRQSSAPRRIPMPIHGMDSDQVLLTEFFGMASTRSSAKERELKTLAMKASEGDLQASKKLMYAMSTGMEKAAASGLPGATKGS